MLPALSLTPRRTSPVGGEGLDAGVAAEDVDMSGTGPGGIASTPAIVERGCGCDCGIALAGARLDMVREVRNIKEEMMGAITMLVAERGLGTWEEERRLENTRAKLVTEQECAEKANVVSNVVAQLRMKEANKTAKASEEEAKVEEAAMRQEAERVARFESEREVNRNL